MKLRKVKGLLQKTMVVLLATAMIGGSGLSALASQQGSDLISEIEGAAGGETVGRESDGAGSSGDSGNVTGEITGSYGPDSQKTMGGGTTDEPSGDTGSTAGTESGTDSTGTVSDGMTSGAYGTESGTEKGEKTTDTDSGKGTDAEGSDGATEGTDSTDISAEGSLANSPEDTTSSDSKTISATLNDDAEYTVTATIPDGTFPEGVNAKLAVNKLGDYSEEIDAFRDLVSGDENLCNVDAGIETFLYNLFDIDVLSVENDEKLQPAEGHSVRLTIPGLSLEYSDELAEEEAAGISGAGLLTDGADIDAETAENNENIDEALAPSIIATPVVFRGEDSDSDGAVDTLIPVANVEYADGTISFDADHFSLYAIGESIEVSEMFMMGIMPLADPTPVAMAGYQGIYIRGIV